MTPLLPAPRGDLTEMLCARLKDSPRRIPSWATVDDDPLGSADVQLALHLCYGLHDDGFEGVDDGWEWEPSLLALRGNLERHFLAELPEHTARGLDGPAVVCDVRRLLGVGGPSLSDYMFQQGGIDELREFVIPSEHQPTKGS